MGARWLAAINCFNVNGASFQSSGDFQSQCLSRLWLEAEQNWKQFIQYNSQKTHKITPTNTTTATTFFPYLLTILLSNFQTTLNHKIYQQHHKMLNNNPDEGRIVDMLASY